MKNTQNRARYHLRPKYSMAYTVLIFTTHIYVERDYVHHK